MIDWLITSNWILKSDVTSLSIIMSHFPWCYVSDLTVHWTLLSCCHQMFLLVCATECLNKINKQLPESAMVMAQAFDSSRAVTQRWRSTSELALRWNVRVPPWEMTMLYESPVWIRELARLIVPRHVWDISDWFLITSPLIVKRTKAIHQMHWCITRQTHIMTGDYKTNSKLYCNSISTMILGQLKLKPWHYIQQTENSVDKGVRFK